MKIVTAVKGNTKKDFKEAIFKCCDDLKNRVDDILCDFDKHIKKISIELDIEYGSVSIIRINKEMNVEEEENSDEQD